MNSHSRMNEGVMLDWLRMNEDAQRIAPTYAEIQSRFDFDSIESARTLIAQLSDAGLIRCKPAGDGRFSFTIRALSRAAPVAMQARSRDVGTDEDDEPDEAADAKEVDLAMAKIKRVLGRGRVPEVPVRASIAKARMAVVPTLRDRPKSVSTNTPGVSVPARKAHSATSSGVAKRIEDRTPPPMPQRHEVETVEAQRGGHKNEQSRPASVDQGPTPASPPAQVAELERAPVATPTQPVEARQPTKPLAKNTRHQVNIKMSSEHFAIVSKLAIAKRMPTGTLVRSMFADFMDGLPVARPALVQPRPKTRIPAAVMKAYLADGRPFDQFMTEMLLLGIEALAGFKAAE